MYNILVCDDDREIVEAIDIYLQQEGYNVLKAYDGEEAVHAKPDREPPADGVEQIGDGSAAQKQTKQHPKLRAPSVQEQYAA